MMRNLDDLGIGPHIALDNLVQDGTDERLRDAWYLVISPWGSVRTRSEKHVFCAVRDEDASGYAVLTGHPRRPPELLSVHTTLEEAVLVLLALARDREIWFSDPDGVQVLDVERSPEIIAAFIRWTAREA